MPEYNYLIYLDFRNKRGNSIRQFALITGHIARRGIKNNFIFDLCLFVNYNFFNTTFQGLSFTVPTTWEPNFCWRILMHSISLFMERWAQAHLCLYIALQGIHNGQPPIIVMAEFTTTGSTRPNSLIFSFKALMWNERFFWDYISQALNLLPEYFLCPYSQNKKPGLLALWQGPG